MTLAWKWIRPLPPLLLYSLSLNTLINLFCSFKLSPSISSRKMVPSSACSNLPFLIKASFLFPTLIPKRNSSALSSFRAGKEFIARLIHIQDIKKDMPFIKVNCSALKEDNAEEFLFGIKVGNKKDAFINKGKNKEIKIV